MTLAEKVSQASNECNVSIVIEDPSALQCTLQLQCKSYPSPLNKSMMTWGNKTCHVFNLYKLLMGVLFV
mgnify:CR=1 FL=1